MENQSNGCLGSTKNVSGPLSEKKVLFSPHLNKEKSLLSAHTKSCWQKLRTRVTLEEYMFQEIIEWFKQFFSFYQSKFFSVWIHFMIFCQFFKFQSLISVVISNSWKLIFVFIENLNCNKKWIYLSSYKFQFLFLLRILMFELK